MSYPNTVIATLKSIGSNSCGDPQHELTYAGGNPPHYNMNSMGDFDYVTIYRCTLTGGTVTWRMIIEYWSGGNCDGIHTFQLATAADDPEGTYGLLVNNQPNTSEGQASVAAATV